MRIIVLSINYWPEETGIGPLTSWRCEYLAGRGHDVTVCTTFPYYPQWRVDESYRRAMWRQEVHNGVTILRSPAWIPARVTSIKRILFETSFLAGNLFRALSVFAKPELLLVVSPPLGLALTATLLGRLWSIPFVFDVMDLQPDAAAELGMLRSGAVLRGLYWLERIGYRRAALVSTLTEGMRQRVISKSIPADKVTLFATRADRTLFLLRRGDDGHEFRRAHGLDGKFIVAHSGNMGIKQGLEVILHAAQLSRNWPEIVYLLIGDGVTRRELEAQAATKGLSNVKFLPVLPRAQFVQALAAADLSLITQQRSVADIVFPSKTATLMTAGCPIVASVNPNSEVARIIDQSGAGLVTPPEDPLTLLNAITRLQRDARTLEDMGAAGRRYAREHWDEDLNLPRMEAELLRVAHKISNSATQISGSTPNLATRPEKSST